MWESLWSPQRGLQLLPNLWICSCCGDWELVPHPLKEDFCLIFHWQWLEWPICCLLRSERSGQVHSVATCFSPQWPISEGNRSINNVSVFSVCFVTSFSFFPLLIEILQPPFVSSAPVRQAEPFTRTTCLPHEQDVKRWTNLGSWRCWPWVAICNLLGSRAFVAEVWVFRALRSCLAAKILLRCSQA